jgi:hypothetical protein
MDMEGKILHQWRKDFKEVWPDQLDFYVSEVHKTHWRRVHLLAGGELLAIFDGVGMVKLDRDSNLVWAAQCRCHHDLWVAEDGDIYTLTHRWLTELEGVRLEQPIPETTETSSTPRFRLPNAAARQDIDVPNPHPGHQMCGRRSLRK